MRFLSISINLLEFFRIISFVFDLKYLSQNSINFNMLGVFWNPQDEQISKLSLDLYLEQHLKDILRFFTVAGAVCHHCIMFYHLKSNAKERLIVMETRSSLLLIYLKLTSQRTLCLGQNFGHSKCLQINFESLGFTNI